MRLDEVSDHYDFIVIDCPPALGILTVNALTCSDSVLIPLQTEYYAMEGLSQVIKNYNVNQKTFKPFSRKGRVLLTMYDKRNNLSAQVEQEIRAHFGDEVFKTVIPRNVKLSEAPSHGKPVILYDIKSSGSVAYMNIAKEIVSRETNRQSKEQDVQNKQLFQDNHQEQPQAGV